MQRPIRFRAWHNGIKKMFGADEMSKDQMALLPHGRFCNVSGADPSLSTFPDMVPMQFTGIMDKNGKEIYEGDIIHSLYANGEPCMHIVKWVNSDARFMIFDLKTDRECGGISQEWINEHKKEVIGNIYESPELLKE